MFGVSPPPVGQALDAKVDLKKDLQDASPKEYKNDFEKTLKEKLDAKEKSKDKLSDASPLKEMKVKKDDKEPEVAKGKGKERDSAEKESSGGTKKRMIQNVDDQIVSMIMASNENEVEIPESKNDLAEIKDSQPTVQPNSAAVSAAVMPFALQPQTETVGAVAKAAVSSQAAVPALTDMNALNEAIVPAEIGKQQSQALPAEIGKQQSQALPAEMIQKLQALQQQQPISPEIASQLQSVQAQSANVSPQISEQQTVAESGQQLVKSSAQQSIQKMEPQQQIASELQQIRSSYDPSLVTPQKAEDNGEELYIQPQILPEQPMMDAMMPSAEKSSTQLMSEVMSKAQQVPVADMQLMQTSAQAATAFQPEVSVMAAAAAIATPVVASTSNSSVFNLEKDLQDEVGFEPDSSSIASSNTKQDEKPVSLKAQQFEKSVYDQLQKMDQRPPAAALQSHGEKRSSQEGSKSDVKSDDGTLKSLKAEAFNPNEIHHVGQSQSEFKNQIAAPTFAGSEQHRAQMLEKNHEENIQKVMNQAEYLVKQGGGEMKVSMSPDGMAEVQLKVLLQDGKVNIEMRTHDKTVKKLMEDSLTELKSGLAAHNLSVEHVKINTVTATNTDNSAQFQSNWNQSGGEQQQREYWNQFQDNLNQRQNSARRSNYGSDSRGSESSSISALGASAGTERAAATPRTYGGTKGSQINWVA